MSSGHRRRPGTITAQGKAWRYHKPSGGNRCENHFPVVLKMISGKITMLQRQPGSVEQPTC